MELLHEPTRPSAAGTGEVEQEGAARGNGSVDGGRQAPEGLEAGPLVGCVAEDLADRGDADAAGRELGVVDGADQEGRGRRGDPGELDHVGREVDAEHSVAGIGQGPRQDPRPAAQVDDRAAVVAGGVQRVEQIGGGRGGQAPEPFVVDRGLLSAVEHDAGLAGQPGFVAETSHADAGTTTPSAVSCSRSCSRSSASIWSTTWGGAIVRSTPPDTRWKKPIVSSTSAPTQAPCSSGSIETATKPAAATAARRSAASARAKAPGRRREPATGSGASGWGRCRATTAAGIDDQPLRAGPPHRRRQPASGAQRSTDVGEPGSGLLEQHHGRAADGSVVCARRAEVVGAGVGLDVRDVRERLGPPAGDRQQRGGDVDAGGRALRPARPGRRQRCGARPTADVQHVRTAPEPRRAQQGFDLCFRDAIEPIGLRGPGHALGLVPSGGGIGGVHALLASS